jgi:hypothetical protein
VDGVTRQRQAPQHQCRQPVQRVLWQHHAAAHAYHRPVRRSGDPPLILQADPGAPVLQNVLIDSLSVPAADGCAVDVRMPGDSYAAALHDGGAERSDKLCLTNYVPSGDRIVDTTTA